MTRPEARRAQALRLEADKLISQITYLAGLYNPLVAMAGVPQKHLAGTDQAPTFTPDPTDPAPVWRVQIQLDPSAPVFGTIPAVFLTEEEAKTYAINHVLPSLAGPAAVRVVRA